MENTKEQNTNTNANENKLSTILSSDGVKTLISNLHLTEEQVQKANASALQLQGGKLAGCNPYSIIRYCYETARYNFTKEDAAYPVPYGNAIQFMIGYKGYQELAYRSGKYLMISANPVKECDTITRDEITGEIIVRFNKDYKVAMNSQIIGFYAFAIGTDHELKNSKFMSKEEVMKHGKTYSKTYGSVWGDEKTFNQMALKTVIKLMCKTLDQTPLLSAGLNEDAKVFNDLGEGSYADNPQNTPKSNNVVNTIFEEETGEINDDKVKD